MRRATTIGVVRLESITESLYGLVHRLHIEWVWKLPKTMIGSDEKPWLRKAYKESSIEMWLALDIILMWLKAIVLYLIDMIGYHNFTIALQKESFGQSQEVHQRTTHKHGRTQRPRRHNAVSHSGFQKIRVFRTPGLHTQRFRNRQIKASSPQLWWVLALKECHMLLRRSSSQYCYQ